MPMRSTGCYLCRKRKTRCDGLRPQCRRCTLYGVVCPGFSIQKPGDVEFRDETRLAAERANHATKRSRRPCPEVVEAFNPAASDGIILGAMPQPTALKILQSPAANRAQLYCAFLDAWVPRNILTCERGCLVEVVHFDPFREMVTTAQDSLVLTSAMDTLSLVSTSNPRRDERLLQEAVGCYAKALRRLALALKTPEAVSDDRILAAVVVLGMCEFYDVIHTSNSRGWQHHQAGLRMLVKARSLQSHRGHYSSPLLAQAKHSLLIMSILARKKDSLDSPQRRNLELKMTAKYEHYDHEVASQLPELLERHDCLDFSSHPALHDIDNLLADFNQLANDLSAHLVSTMSSRPMATGQYYTSECIEKFSPFSKLVSNRCMKEAYRFSSFTCAFQHVAYWTRMLDVQTSIYSLNIRRDHLLQECRVETIRSKAKLSDYVSHLCRSIPFLIEPANSLIGHVCCFQPLLGVTNHFGRFGRWYWLEWAKCVRTSIFNQGLSIPKLGDERMATTIAVT